MSFNSDPCKQVQRTILAVKQKITVHPQLVFNNNPVHQTSAQKHLAIFLDFKLKLLKHFEDMLNTLNKTIKLLRQLQSTLPRPLLLTM